MGKETRKLDDARMGLLIRMNYHRTTICSKRTQEPLLKRGLTMVSGKGYKVTPAGEKLVKEFVNKPEKTHLVTWESISIGDLVMIVKDNKKKNPSERGAGEITQ